MVAGKRESLVITNLARRGVLLNLVFVHLDLGCFFLKPHSAVDSAFTRSGHSNDRRYR